MRHGNVWILVAAVTVLLAERGLAQDVHGDQLQIVEGHAGLDPDNGFVRIRGEVWNRSGQWINSPRVLVELFDAAGKPIQVSGFLAETKKEMGVDQRDSVVTQRYFVAPGEVAVFDYLRDPAKLGKARYASHKLSAAAWATSNAPKVAIEGFQSSVDADGNYTVSGTIKNVGTVACRSPKAVLGFYTADGKVALATDEQPEAMFQKQLAAGQSVRFLRKGMTTPTGLAIKDVKAWGDCSDPD